MSLSEAFPWPWTVRGSVSAFALLLILGAGGCKARGLGASGVDASSPDDTEDAGRKTTEEDPRTETPWSAPDAAVAVGGINPDPSPFALDFVPVETEGPRSRITDLVAIPGTDEFLATTKDGWLLRYRLREGRAELLHELRMVDPATGEGEERALFFLNFSDCGLLSIALSPDYEETGHIYVSGCRTGTTSSVYRMTYSLPDDESRLLSLQEIISSTQEGTEKTWHNVGDIGFDASGQLYVLFGDRTVVENSQDVTNLQGTVVRISPRELSGVPEEGLTYDPSPGNAFADPNDGRPEIYVYGLRNPWRALVDDLGRMWVGDVGAKAVEEINLITAAGQNFGWPEAEGPCEGCPYEQPLLHWVREDETGYLGEDPEAVLDGAAFVGVQYLRNAEDRYEGHMDNRVIFGDFFAGFIRVAEASEAGEVVYDRHVGHLVGATSFIHAGDGYIYASRYYSEEYEDGSPVLYRAELAD